MVRVERNGLERHGAYPKGLPQPEEALGCGPPEKDRSQRAYLKGHLGASVSGMGRFISYPNRYKQVLTNVSNKVHSLL